MPIQGGIGSFSERKLSALAAVGKPLRKMFAMCKTRIGFWAHAGRESGTYFISEHCVQEVRTVYVCKYVWLWDRTCG